MLLSILGMVLFDDGEDLQVIEVPLISSSKFEEFVEFKVVLIEPQGKCSLGNNQKENISKKNCQKFKFGDIVIFCYQNRCKA